MTNDQPTPGLNHLERAKHHLEVVRASLRERPDAKADLHIGAAILAAVINIAETTSQAVKRPTTHDWLEAVDRDDHTSDADLLAAYRILGADTDQSTKEFDEAFWNLRVWGYVEPRGIDQYELAIPADAA